MTGDNLRKRLGCSVRERLPSTSERAQVGIGTLIVFIAMVLVAAIAAGVLINTAGFLQSSAEQTGDESQNQVTNRVQVVSKTGVVAAGNNEAISTVKLSVKRSSGADDIDLSSATVQWLGPEGETDLTHADSPSATTFNVTAVQDESGSAPILDEKSDLFKIRIDASAILSGDGLGEGDSVELKITTSSGATEILRLRVPSSLSGDEAVTL